MLGARAFSLSQLSGTLGSRCGGVAPSAGWLRHVTDIQYYKEVDQSHLHLKEAQSTRRKFLLKLSKRERILNQRAQAKISVESAAAAPKPEEEEVMAGHAQKEVVVPTYIERTPSAMLRLFSSQLEPDYTAPDYRYHDDPHLTPYSHNDHQSFLLSKHGGKAAARYVVSQHPHLFTGNRVEMEPSVKKLIPSMKIDFEKPSVEMLDVLIEGFNVADAYDLFQALKEKGVEVSEDRKQKLLELLAYHNHEALTDDEYLYLGYNQSQRLVDQAPNWLNEKKAMDVYLSMEPTTSSAREALFIGYAKTAMFKKASEMLQTMEGEGDKLSLEGYNAKILCCSGEIKDNILLEAVGVLQEMQSHGFHPDIWTLEAVLSRTYRVIQEHRQHVLPCLHFARNIFEEFQRVGVEPCFYNYAQLFKMLKKSVSLRKTILKHLQQKQKSFRLQHPNDGELIVALMMEAKMSSDVQLAYTLHEFILTASNQLLLNHHRRLFLYYTCFLEVLLSQEPLDVFMTWYAKISPRSLCPNYSMYESICKKLFYGKLMSYMPQIWADLNLSNFCGVNVSKRLTLSRKIIEYCQETELASSEQGLKEPFLQIAREAFAFVQDQQQSGQRHIPSSDSIPICASAINLALMASDFPFASKIMNFVVQHGTDLVGVMDVEAIQRYVDFAIANEEVESAFKAVVYAAEMNVVQAEDMARQLAQTDGIDLETYQRAQFNQLLAQSDTWEPLEK